MEQPDKANDAPDAPSSAGEPEAGPSADASGGHGRRPGRTAALIGTALVLGLFAGTCAGYLVQAGREPTPLPPLSQPVLPQATGKAPAPLPAAQDRRVRTDGDLRALLLEKPPGAGKADRPMGDDGWRDLADYAGDYDRPELAFGRYAMDEFRRAAVTGWVDDGYRVEIQLVQFRQEKALGADLNVDHLQGGAEAERDTDSWAVPGTGNGRAYVHNRAETESGYEPLYSAEAYGWRGDVVMEIRVYGSERVGRKTILDLAERQMERL
ncbi:hypothetical protein GCM10010261_55000 [Streptomyces pilosus]|uniref:hypothetical protein n=1 Tax=Streptomyces pilosus TaxID=28893 RepID=UPI0019864F22|nr:hypothetical protein [Streptomyces pilosus]GGV64367.1 hypothetical protein GCM10010261_55000 [Streptomyces pilosus]